MPNPITERLDQLHDQWVAFARDARSRVLLWRARVDELSLIDAFVARECDVEHADTPDLFVQLATPFTSEPQHGHALREELCAQASEAAQDAWQCPAPQGDGLHCLVAALSSLHAHLAGDSDARLAVWLDPPHVQAGYALWLQRLAHAAPPQLRFIVVDTDGAVAALADAEPARVHAVDCALDMPGALDALTPDAGTPGDRFRRLQVRLAASVAAGDLADAKATAGAAAELAGAQGWPQLAVSVQLTLASAYAAHAQPTEAVATYREAEKSAALCSQTSQLREQLRLIAVLGCGSVWLGAAAYALAADAYMEAALLAKELADAPRELDCYRLASFCCVQQGQRERAWALGVQGLQCAMRMDAAQRASSTLPYLAQQLTRIGDDARSVPLERHLAELLGTNWRAQLSALA